MDTNHFRHSLQAAELAAITTAESCQTAAIAPDECHSNAAGLIVSERSDSCIFNENTISISAFTRVFRHATG